FRPSEDRQAERHFVALDTRFERAMDMIENARELVIGSFELFSGQVALRTDGTMRVLTFVTVVAGVLATFVGALGMNFQAGVFESKDVGFWSVVGGLLLFSAAVTVFARRRRWF
ncbi:MAG: CorA family divalent cation transporter, partial [Stenotrophomonas sp.]